MYPVHRSDSFFYSSGSMPPPSSPVESVSSSESQDRPSEPEAPRASPNLDLMSLSRPIWDISWDKSEIVVDGHSFKPAEGRQAFINLLNYLKIPLVFQFELEKRVCKPDDSYEKKPTRPMPFDLLPLLEYRRKLMNDGKSTRGLEDLIHWLIQHYLPDEPILFAICEAENNKIETEELSIGVLMMIYGLTEYHHETYQPLPLELTISECHGIDAFFSPFQPAEIEHMKRALRDGIEQWGITRDPKVLSELASFITIANEILPHCPPDQSFSLSRLMITANEILFCADQEAYCMPIEPKREEPPLSPESARRRRREEKEKAISPVRV